MPKRKSPRKIIRKVKVPKGVVLSYKDSETLKLFVTEQGALLPREATTLSQKNQRKLAREVKRARHLALLPFTQTL
ncbi:MAG: 30S ribosomal protein S18 [Pseudomonadales bacterium]|nr:30S ribosomal protein S18 [Candidatus Woesebacteria bacterium]MCB9801999.1 30S ribosomal protein S18 [Pseudomonadales bacterium]